MADVFISYKRDERAGIEQIAEHLRALQLSVWFDASMSAGEAFNAEIDREARGANAILVCWSPAARQSEWVNAEAMIGFTQKKLAACYVAGPDGFDPPTPFNTSHAEDLRAWLAAPSEIHAGWKSVLRRIGKLCGRADIETWGALASQANATELRVWIAAHEASPLFMTVDGLLQAREAEDSQRARLEQEARWRRAIEVLNRQSSSAVQAFLEKWPDHPESVALRSSLPAIERAERDRAAKQEVERRRGEVERKAQSGTERRSREPSERRAHQKDKGRLWQLAVAAAVFAGLIYFTYTALVMWGNAAPQASSPTAISQDFDTALSPASVFGRFATTPINTSLVPGVTVTRVTANRAAGRVVFDLSFDNGGGGTAAFIISAHGSGSHIRLELDVGARNDSGVHGTAGEVFASIGSELAHPSDSGRGIDGTTFNGLRYEVATVVSQHFAYNEYCTPQAPSEVKEAVRQSIVAVRAFLGSHELSASGPPIAIETGWNARTHQYCFEIGLPFSGGSPSHVSNAGVRIGQTPSGQAMHVHYAGAEENIFSTYDEMETAMWAAHMTIGKSFEVYNDDPLQAAGSLDRDIYYLFTGDAALLQQIAPSAP